MVYQHSETFAQLKVIKEDIAQNYSSHQYLSTLDHFLERALDPIVTANPGLIDNYFAKVVAWQSHKPSIKFSRDPKGALPALLFNALTTEGQTKRKWQQTMLLNRGLLYGLLSIFADTVNKYKMLHDPWVSMSRAARLNRISREEIKTSQYLWASIQEFEYWAELAYKFKGMILQKYVRMTLMQAQRTYKEIEHVIKLDDVVQIYLTFLSKAIDRCDSRQGVLTTFIQTWFYSARAEVLKLAAESNKSNSYEHMMENGVFLSTEPNADYETMQHLAHEAKRIDPQGIVRFSLGIPEFYTQAQLQTLRLFTEVTTHH